jgi:hypothetical protein
VKRTTRSMKAFALACPLALVACAEVGGEVRGPSSDARAAAAQSAPRVTVPSADLPGEARGRPPGDVFQSPYPDEDEEDEQS